MNPPAPHTNAHFTISAYSVPSLYSQITRFRGETGCRLSELASSKVALPMSQSPTDGGASPEAGYEPPGV
jgi:hypothetical protein